MTDYKRERTDVIAQAVEDGELDRAEAGEILVARALRKLAKRRAGTEDALLHLGTSAHYEEYRDPKTGARVEGAPEGSLAGEPGALTP